jgi:hypothetical protein
LDQTSNQKLQTKKEKNMNTLVKSSIERPFLRSCLGLITVALGCFQLAGPARAVVPAPDGGYPGGNTAEGSSALLSLNTGQYNAAIGWLSLRSVTTGSFNTGVGAGTLFANTGDKNTATGAAALFSNATGNYNTATGFSALVSNTTGLLNTATGFTALDSNTTGGSNTATGAAALGHNTTGSYNIALGIGAGSNVTTPDNVISIGVYGANVSFSCYVGNIWNKPGGSQAVYVNSEGKLGQMVSSRRFKDEIQPMEQASGVIYSLKPVSFRYKPEIEPTRPVGFGLIAEDVEKINPALVTRGSDGKPSSVRYDAVNAMLLNEFLKAHRKMQEQDRTIARQQKQIEALASHLQKVSAQVQLSNASPRTALK